MKFIKIMHVKVQPNMQAFHPGAQRDQFCALGALERRYRMRQFGINYRCASEYKSIGHFHNDL